MRVLTYTDKESRDLTGFVTNVSITRSTLEPYENSTIDLLIPFEIMFDVFPQASTGVNDLDTWVVIFDKVPGEQRERAQFIGRIVGITSGLRALSQERGAGMIKNAPLSLSCDNWLQPVRNGQIYLSGKSPLEGHILDKATAGARFKELASLPLTTRNVGVIFSRFWSEYAKYYRLPKTLINGEDLATWANTVSTTQDAQNLTPERANQHRDVFGLALNAASFTMNSTAWGIIRNAFQGDPNIIELFTTLEPTEDEYLDSDKLLGVSPCIVYRIKPFIEDGVTVSSMIPHPRTHAIELNRVISVDFNQQDADRINAVYLDSPLTPSAAVELFGVAADPILKKEDINRAGLRLYRGVWPFFPVGRKRKSQGGYQKEIQEVIKLVSSIVLNRHRYLNGSITLDQNLKLRAGLWCVVGVGSRSLYLYVDSVTHTSSVNDSGLMIKRSYIEFVRGFIE